MSKKQIISFVQPGFALALVIVNICIVQVFAYEPKTLEIGAPAPAFDLLGTDDKRHKLSDFADNPVLVVIFTTNHCPDAIASYPRMCRLVDDYARRGVSFV